MLGFDAKNGSNAYICRDSLILFWVSRFESLKELGIWLVTQGLIVKELRLVNVVWILVVLN